MHGKKFKKSYYKSNVATCKYFVLPGAGSLRFTYEVSTDLREIAHDFQY